MRKFILFLALSFALTVHAQSAPIIRAKLLPSSDVLVGQPLRLQVELLVPNYFTGAPTFPQFELDGAIVTLSEDRPEHFNEQISGTTFAGIRRFYLIYPEQPSKFRVPSVEISVPYASAPPATTLATLHLPPLTFRAALPPGARNLDYFLPTSRLALQQKWSGPLNHLHVGDSVSRTIVITTEKMQAMLIPPLQLIAPDGVHVYPKQPALDDQKTVNGVFTQGVRTERASYLFTKPGEYLLPEIAITWWNLATQKPVTSTLPSTTLHIADSNAYVSELPPQQETPAPVVSPQRNWRHYLPVFTASAIALVILVIFAWLVHRWRPPLLARYRAFVDRRRDSEPAHWRRFKQACHRNDASQSYALLLAWLRRSRGAITLNEFQRQAADPQFSQQISLLSQLLFAFAPTAPWNGRLFFNAIASHRHIAQLTKPAQTHLPPLNPNNSGELTAAD